MNPNAVDHNYGRTAAHWAAHTRQSQMLGLLMVAGECSTYGMVYCVHTDQNELELGSDCKQHAWCMGKMMHHVCMIVNSPWAKLEPKCKNN